MDIMAIAAAGMDFKTSQLQQDVQITLLKKAMDSQEAQGAQLVQSLVELPNPARLLDIKI